MTVLTTKTTMTMTINFLTIIKNSLRPAERQDAATPGNDHRLGAQDAGHI